MDVIKSFSVVSAVCLTFVEVGKKNFGLMEYLNLKGPKGIGGA